MNQNTKLNSSEWKGLVVNVILSALAFFLIILVGAFVLLNVQHFERFYGVLVNISMGFTSIVISILSNRLRGNVLVYSLITSITVVITFLIISLICSPGGFSLGQLIPYIVLIFSTLIVSYLMSKGRGKRYKRKNFSYKR